MLHSKPVELFLSTLKKVLPAPLQKFGRKLWHPLLSFGVALVNGFPAQQMTIVGITGTKGKSTVSDMMFHILSSNGKKTALASTIRFVIGGEETKNSFKMTMPGRGFLQGFLKKARTRGVTHAVIEITSEGTKLARNKYLALDALIVTNIQKEHIESHGSFENYVAAKRSIVHELEVSQKRPRTLVANADNEHSKGFLAATVEHAVPFSSTDLTEVVATDSNVSFIYKEVAFSVPLAGVFNAYNALSAIKVAEALDITPEESSQALRTLPQVRGRVEPIDEGQEFKVIVDYAHTPDSLEALYGAFPSEKKICILGNTGGGRDTWKRPTMGAIADSTCDTVILTNEDPYDEEPQKIMDEMAHGMKRAPRIIMDRREAIREAITEALATNEGQNVVVLISGKGTDPYIMEANGKKTPWSDSAVAREELRALLKKT